MIRGQNIICISSIDWDFIWQGHQEIMSRFAAHGNRVLFIENTGIRAPTWRDLPRLRSRLQNWRRGTRGFRQVAENLYVYAPVLLPFPYSRGARWINRLFIEQDLRRWLEIMEFRAPVIWTFLPTALARDLTKTLRATLVIYYCIDDFAASSRQAAKIKRSEVEMFRTADLVFVTSSQLERRARQYSQAVHLFPFGVNLERFEAVRTSETVRDPEDLAAISRPRLGYVGGIHRWVDLELLREVAVRYPKFQLVLVGPIQTDVEPLRGLPNVHLLGSKPHA